MTQTSRVARGRRTTVSPGSGPEAGGVRYHWTYVAEWDRTRIVLRTGGYRTATTKLRMNQAAAEFALGYHVAQRGGVWFVTFGGVSYAFVNDVIELDRTTGRLYVAPPPTPPPPPRPETLPAFQKLAQAIRFAQSQEKP